MRCAVLALIALAAAGPADAQGRWQPAAPENREVLPTFNAANVESVLAEIGARFERRGVPAQPSLMVTFASGRRAAIVFGSCNADASACRSISLQAGWPSPAGVSPQRIADSVDEFARRYALSRAMVLANGELALQRYLTADYGFIRGNLAVNLIAFSAQADLFVEEVIAPLSSGR